ncbi:hypothetical protein HUJ04_001512 [Dendroctonus ponderosae]|nr:hypothetical protein HUJ04_001512 [Dendroctonus ponderosae]
MPFFQLKASKNHIQTGTHKQTVVHIITEEFLWGSHACFAAAFGMFPSKAYAYLDVIEMSISIIDLGWNFRFNRMNMLYMPVPMSREHIERFRFGK